MFALASILEAIFLRVAFLGDLRQHIAEAIGLLLIAGLFYLVCTFLVLRRRSPVSPALVVGAEDDIVTPSYFSEELARLIPGAEVKMFPRGGHCFTQTAARDFNNAVLPFLAAHSPAA